MSAPSAGGVLGAIVDARMSGPTRDDQSFVAAGDDDALRLPDGRDLSASLRFHPHEGRILLGDERMVLLHVHALAELRRELIDTLGIERARATFIRLGYASGQRDAHYARKLRADASPFDLLAAGPQLHALEGMVHVTPLEVRFDIDRGHYHGEFAWRNSAEVDAHLRVHGVSESPVCWTLIGYASGYTSAFMGRPVVYRELSCRACGARRCRMLGKPLAAWSPPLEEFAFLASEPLRPTSPPSAPPPPSPPTSGPLVGASSAFRAIWSQLQRVAGTDTPVLLCGETGTGKDTLARALHTHGPRAAGPFIAVPCAALRPEQADELARRLAAAADGTLYLDDIEALPPNLQAELAHALDRATDLRLVAASRHDLLHGTWSERLSPALLHRIGVFPVYVPPLRERRDDLPLLMRHLLEAQAARQRKRVPGFTERAAAALLEHDYPGNVRELKNLIERAVVLVADGAAIDVGHLFGGLDRPVALLGLGADGSLRSAADAPPPPPPLPDASLIDRLIETQTSLEALEEALIRGAVARADGNLSAAARTLGLTRPQLAYRFRKSGRDPTD